MRIALATLLIALVCVTMAVGLLDARTVMRKRQAPSGQPAAPSASANCSRIIETCPAAIRSSRNAARYHKQRSFGIRAERSLCSSTGLSPRPHGDLPLLFSLGPPRAGAPREHPVEGSCGSCARQRSNRFGRHDQPEAGRVEDDRYNITELSALPHCAIGVPESSYTDGACRLLDTEGLTWGRRPRRSPRPCQHQSVLWSALGRSRRLLERAGHHGNQRPPAPLTRCPGTPRARAVSRPPRKFLDHGGAMMDHLQIGCSGASNR